MDETSSERVYHKQTSSPVEDGAVGEWLVGDITKNCMLEPPVHRKAGDTSNTFCLTVAYLAEHIYGYRGYLTYSSCLPGILARDW